MLKKFKKSFFPPMKQHIFSSAQLNAEHTPLNICRLNKIIRMLHNCQQLDEAIRILEKCMQEKHHVLKLKTLMTCHYLFKKLGKNQILAIVNQKYKSTSEKIKTTQDYNENSDFIEKIIISPYKQYLENLYVKQQLYEYAHKFSSKDHLEPAQIFDQGFQCLNLMEKILQTRSSMSKVARYFPKNHEYNTLYLLYVEDLLTFNSYIKWLANQIINYFQRILQDGSQLIKNRHIFKQIYIFLTECQRTSDLLNQFYFNRYFYENLKVNFHLPVILNIKIEVFDKLLLKICQVDRLFYKQIHKKRGKNHRSTSCQHFTTEELINNLNELHFEKNYFSCELKESIADIPALSAV